MKRNTGIDILRGLSMLYIVGFWHLLEYTHAIANYQNDITHRITWITLGTFFFISGYLIGLRKISLTARELGRFYLKKFWRIYPLYLVAIVWFTDLGISRHSMSVKAALGISVFDGPAPPTLWFVAMIIVFYLVAPVLRYCSEKRKGYEVFLLNLVIMAAMYAYLQMTHRLELRMLVYFSVFFLGVHAGVNRKIFTYRKTIFCLAVLSFMLSYFTRVHSLPMKLLTVVPMISLCPLYIVMMGKDIDVTSPRLRAAIMALSYASYCMYLFHRPVYIFANRFYFPDTPWLQVVYLVGVCLPFVIVFSYLVQKSYDLALKTTAAWLTDGRLSRNS